MGTRTSIEASATRYVEEGTDSNEERPVQHELVNRKMKKGDRVYTITAVLLDHALKPYKNASTYRPTIEYSDDATGEKHYGVLGFHIFTTESIIAVLKEKGFDLLETAAQPNEQQTE